MSNTPIDMAYRAYVDQRNQCEAIQHPGQQQACMQIAAQQMAGSIDNYLNQQTQPVTPDQWVPENPEPQQDVTLNPPPEYTPGLPLGIAPQQAAEPDGAAADGDAQAEPTGAGEARAADAPNAPDGEEDAADADSSASADAADSPVRQEAPAEDGQTE